MTGLIKTEDDTTVPDYTIIKWTCADPTISGNDIWTVPDGVTSVEYLVVGGGGPGGVNIGGGGGAGAFRTGSSFPVSGNISIQVGAGGLCAVTGYNGEDSIFSSITAIGGGYGGDANYKLAGDGGSGGGGDNWVYGDHIGGIGSEYGHNGGNGYYSNTTTRSGGGGGGAGADGVAGSSGRGGNGGNGLQSDITGNLLYYAGGGGGAGYTFRYPKGVGGLGGGGTAGVSGTNGLGGGGGSGFILVSPKIYTRGGSGVVIIKYTATTSSKTIRNGISFGSTNIMVI